MTARRAGVSASVGGGAPGAGRRPPSPGRSCTLTVTTEYDDGSDPVTYELTWVGYTATQARARRLATLRDTGRTVHTARGGALIVPQLDGSVQTLTWTNNPTDGGDAP